MQGPLQVPLAPGLPGGATWPQISHPRAELLPWVISLHVPVRQPGSKLTRTLSPQMRAAEPLVGPAGALPGHRSAQARASEHLSRGFSGAAASLWGAQVDLKLEWALTTQSLFPSVAVAGLSRAALFGDVGVTLTGRDLIAREEGRRASLSLSPFPSRRKMATFIWIIV